MASKAVMHFEYISFLDLKFGKIDEIKRIPINMKYLSLKMRTFIS